MMEVRRRLDCERGRRFEAGRYFTVIRGFAYALAVAVILRSQRGVSLQGYFTSQMATLISLGIGMHDGSGLTHQLAGAEAQNQHAHCFKSFTRSIIYQQLM